MSFPKLSLTDGINLGLIGMTASAVIYMFTQFASAKDIDDVKAKHDEDMGEHAEHVSDIKLDQWYGQYYDRLDDRDESIEEGNDALAAEYERQMERLRAKICEVDPEWERCDG